MPFIKLEDGTVAHLCMGKRGATPSAADIAALESARDHLTAAKIFDRYRKHFNGEVQGCCPLIADEIQRAIGGAIVAGYLVYGGGSRRSHWWVEKAGEAIDPMAEYLFAPEDYMHREEAHRDRAIFERILPDYEQWRAPK